MAILASATGAVAGPSKSKRALDVQRRPQKQLQRRWIQLVESWTHSSATDRVELLERITHHSQVIAKSVRDRDWLVVAFRMAVCAVLFPSTSSPVSRDVPQLGQQLLQLAIHSVCRPYINQLAHDDTSRQTRVRDALAWSEQLARRLAVYETLGGLTEMLDLPSLDLDFVLSQNAACLVSSLAALPQACDLLAPLLQRHANLVVESADARLAIVAQLIRSSSNNLPTLANAGLLISWKDGAETSIWSSIQPGPVTKLDLETVTRFYTDQVVSLCEIGCVQEAQMLCTVLRSEFQGNDGQAALNRISSAIVSQKEEKGPSRQGEKNQPIIDLAQTKALVATVPLLSESTQVRTVAAQKTLAKLSPSTFAADLVHMVDVGDSAAVRAHVVTVLTQASQPPSSPFSAHLAALLVTVVYARPAAGSFRINLACSTTLLDLFISTASALASSPSGRGTISSLLRTTLDANSATVVPACQLFAQSKGTVEEALLHLTWLRSIVKLMAAVGPMVEADAIDVCWLAAYGGPGASGSASKQEEALIKLIQSFSAAFPASRSDRGGFDVASLRVKAAWTSFFQTALALCGSTDESVGPFAALTVPRIAELVLSGVLRTGDVDLFRTLSNDSSIAQTLSVEDKETLVLTVSTELYDRATMGSMRNKDMKMALDVLEAAGAPSGTGSRILAQRNFIEATCRLCSFKVKSRLYPGKVMEPHEIRATQDRMDLVGRLLATQEDAYRSPELVLDLASKLCATGPTMHLVGGQSGLTPSQRTMIEIRTLAMLADSATSSGQDFDEAAAFCHELVAKVSVLRTRTCAAGSMASTAATEMLDSAVDLGWKSCFQLSKHPGWEDTPSRITMLAHALTLCPAAQLQGMLKQWSVLDQQLLQELKQGKTFTSTRNAAAGWLNLGASTGSSSSSSGGGVGTQHLTAQNAAVTAASVGAGLMGMGANAAANLLPLRFSPLAYFHSPATMASKPEDEGLRAARLFDFDSAPASAGMDPTERAVRAARSARDFLGWKGSQHPKDEQSERTTGFSLTKGVGWLIGDDKH